MLLSIENLRQDYRRASLDIADVPANPLEQFRKWFQEALDAQLPEPNAMTLATATPDGKATLRVVLLKGVTENGFVFYTNYDSRKGKTLLANPYAAVNFFWQELERQVRIEGKVEKTSPAQSTAYFQSRPKGSQIGAWASPQSAVIEDRKMLEIKVLELEDQYKSETVLPRPEHWGGFLLQPNLMEFWQGRPNRLHDRIQYTLQTDGDWQIVRLAP
jgi:pyridoxamine 5'-phosphate oxidase